jgi:hypothetical protein
LSDPVTTIAPIFPSESNSFSAAFSSSIRGVFSALSAFGRLRRTTPTRPCVSTMMFEYLVRAELEASTQSVGREQSIHFGNFFSFSSFSHLTH